MSAREQTSDSAAWVLVGTLLLAVAALEWCSPLAIDPSSLGALLTACAALGGTALFYRTIRKQENFTVICIGLAQVLLFSAIGSIMSYLLAREGGALWDSRLAGWDRGLGFDWLAYIHWVDRSPALTALLHLSYGSLIPQIIVLVLALGFSLRVAELRTVMLAAMLSGTVTILLSTLFPAVGYYVYGRLALTDFHNINPWAGFIHESDFTALRSGAMTILRLDQMQGIVTFPSYHAALATVTLWGFWSSRLAWLKWPGAAVAVATLFATPVDGGHYLVDVLAGIAVGATAIALAGRAIRWRPSSAVIRSSPFRRSRAAFGQ